jgi:hypothetical protein
MESFDKPNSKARFSITFKIAFPNPNFANSPETYTARNSSFFGSKAPNPAIIPSLTATQVTSLPSLIAFRCCSRALGVSAPQLSVTSYG